MARGSTSAIHGLVETGAAPLRTSLSTALGPGRAALVEPSSLASLPSSRRIRVVAASNIRTVNKRPTGIALELCIALIARRKKLQGLGS